VFGLGITRDRLLRRRKSLGFGPAHPHAVFRSYGDSSFEPLVYAAVDSDPYEVAERFLVDTLGGGQGQGQGWVVRKDSYMDGNTGVTHVYVRQLVNGIEVVDGDINLNVKDGEVFSFGNSVSRGCSVFLCTVLMLFKFYNGLTPEFHGAQCHGSRDRQGGGDQQVVMAMGPHERSCAHDPRVPLLHFMAVATPDDSLVADIAARFQEYLHNISMSSFEANVVGSRGLDVELLHNVPETVNPVMAKIAYAQVPDGGSATTALRLVWKVCNVPFLLLVRWLIYRYSPSSKSRCGIIGTKRLYRPCPHTISCPWWTGLRIRFFSLPQSHRPIRSLLHTTSLLGA
jgi:extracellular elastinolytic metalloproteinase